MKEDGGSRRRDIKLTPTVRATWFQPVFKEHFREARRQSQWGTANGGSGTVYVRTVDFSDGEEG